GGHIEGLLKDATTHDPLKNLNLRVTQRPNAQGRGSRFWWYATTDDKGRFRTISLFPGEYDVDVNSTTMGYPVLGRGKVEAGKTTFVNCDAVSLPKVIGGRVLDAAGQPIAEVEVTLLAPKDSDAELYHSDDFEKIDPVPGQSFVPPGWNVLNWHSSPVWSS